MAMKEKPNFKFESANFDQAILLTGYGRFHYEIIALCSISALMVGFQNGLSSYVFPPAQCELNLTSFQLGLLNVCFLIGGTLSCFIWGVLADFCGRRRVLITSHLLNSFITIVCSVLPYTASLVICRFFNGFLIGAPGTVVFSYISEFQPARYRARCVCCCGLFFTLAWLLLPVSAYLMLPLEVSYEIPKLILITPWRLLMILIALPELLVGMWFLRMPESPKFYLAKGNSRKSLAILRKMYSLNTRKCSAQFPVKYLIDIKSEYNIAEKILYQRKTSRILRKMFNQIKGLFQPPLLKATALICTIMFSNMFGMFGLGLWLPDLFVRFVEYQKLHPNDSISIKELSSLPSGKNTTCEPVFDDIVIQSTIATAAFSIFYNALCSWLSTRVSTKTITMTSMILGGAATASIFATTSALQNLLVACVFQGTMITANMTIAGLGVELFPTKINSIAVCLIMCSGRLGAALSNVVFGYLVEEHCEVPISIVAVVVIVGALLCILVPKPSENCLQKTGTKDGISVIGRELHI